MLLVLSGVAICAPLGAQGLGAQGAPPKFVLFGLLLGPRRGDNLSFLGVGGVPPRSPLRAGIPRGRDVRPEGGGGSTEPASRRKEPSGSTEPASRRKFSVSMEIPGSNFGGNFPCQWKFRGPIIVVLGPPLDSDSLFRGGRGVTLAANLWSQELWPGVGCRIGAGTRGARGGQGAQRQRQTWGGQGARAHSVSDKPGGARAHSVSDKRGPRVGCRIGAGTR